MFLRILQHLLPRSKAWTIVVDKILRQFFAGLAGFFEDIKTFFDDRYDDHHPQRTQQLDLWEEQFGLVRGTNLTEQQRRDRLEAIWKAVGRQDPRYIEDTLRGAGFDVYVHEWWVPGSNPPIVRDPNAYAIQTLVNKIKVRQDVHVQCGEALAQSGEPNAQCGNILGSAFADKVYPVPSDPNVYPYFYYIGGQTFPNVATVPLDRKEEFEDLVLRIGPLQLWVGLLIHYQ